MLDVGCSINTAYSLLGLWPLWFGPQMGEHTGSPLHAINWIRIPNSTFHIPHSVLRPIGLRGSAHLRFPIKGIFRPRITRR